MPRRRVVPSSGSERVRSPKMASAAGRRAVRIRPLRTIPGCPDAYRRYSSRPYPLLTRGAPLRPTAAAAHRVRIGPCESSLVGIRTAGNRPMSTNWRHAASGRAGLHTPPDRSEPEDGVGTRTPRGVSSSSPDDSRPSRCLQTMLRKALSSPDARRAAQTNSVRRAASTVPPIEPSHGRGRAAAAVRFYGAPRTRRG